MKKCRHKWESTITETGPGGLIRYQEAECVKCGQKVRISDTPPNEVKTPHPARKPDKKSSHSIVAEDVSKWGMDFLSDLSRMPDTVPVWFETRDGLLCLESIPREDKNRQYIRRMLRMGAPSPIAFASDKIAPREERIYEITMRSLKGIRIFSEV